MDNNEYPIVQKSLEYYDKYQEKYAHIFNKKLKVSILYKYSDIERDEIIFHDENGKEVLRSTYELVGIYSIEQKLWIWAWAAPFRKNLTYKSRKILNYGLDLDAKDHSYLKSSILTSRSKVSSRLQLEIYMAMAAYLTKIPVIYEYTTDNITEVLFLNKPITSL